MEPLKDRELDELLAQWKDEPMPPEAAATIEARAGQLMQAGLHAELNRAWYSRIWSGSIAVPVPLAAAMLIVVIASFVWAVSRPGAPASGPQPAAPSQTEVTLADFAPAQQSGPRIIRSTNEEDKTNETSSGPDSK